MSPRFPALGPRRGGLGPEPGGDRRQESAGPGSRHHAAGNSGGQRKPLCVTNEPVHGGCSLWAVTDVGLIQ